MLTGRKTNLITQMRKRHRRRLTKRSRVSTNDVGGNQSPRRLQPNDCSGRQYREAGAVCCNSRPKPATHSSDRLDVNYCKSPNKSRNNNHFGSQYREANAEWCNSRPKPATHFSNQLGVSYFTSSDQRQKSFRCQSLQNRFWFYVTSNRLSRGLKMIGVCAVSSFVQVTF